MYVSVNVNLNILAPELRLPDCTSQPGVAKRQSSLSPSFSLVVIYWNRKQDDDISTGEKK